MGWRGRCQLRGRETPAARVPSGAACPGGLGPQPPAGTRGGLAGKARAGLLPAGAPTPTRHPPQDRGQTQTRSHPGLKRLELYLPLSPPGQMHDSEMPAFCAVLQPAGRRSQPAPQHRLPSPCGFPPAPGSHLPIGLRPGPAFWGAQARIPGHLNTPRALYLEVLSQAVFKIQFLYIDFLFRMSLILILTI